MDIFSKTSLTIKETWLQTLRLYREILPKTWQAGVTATTIIAIATLIDKIGIPRSELHIVIVGTMQLISSLTFIYWFSLLMVKIYNIEQGSDLPWRNAISFVNQRYLKVVACVLVTLSIEVLGFFSMIIPGILATVLLSMAHPLVLLDGKGVIESIKSSCSLVWSDWWHAFGAIFPLLLINFLMNFSISYAATRNKQLWIAYSGLILAAFFYPLFYCSILTVFNKLKLRKSL